MAQESVIEAVNLHISKLWEVAEKMDRDACCEGRVGSGWPIGTGVWSEKEEFLKWSHIVAQNQQRALEVARFIYRCARVHFRRITICWNIPVVSFYRSKRTPKIFRNRDRVVFSKWHNTVFSPNRKVTEIGQNRHWKSETTLRQRSRYGGILIAVRYDTPPELIIFPFAIANLAWEVS